MKYAILGDIHANLEALQAVLADARHEGVTRFACVGDLVGYAANPKECVALVRELDCPIVKGNFDEYASTEDDCPHFRPRMVACIRWTRQQLSNEDRRWLRDLELVRQVASFTLVHATLDMPQKWGYVYDKLAAASHFFYQKSSVCFFGHTHQPFAFVRDSVIHGGLFETLKIEPGKKYFINVGSVGQPRNGDPRAAYVIYDLRKQLVTLRRIPYDIATAERKIREAGFWPPDEGASPPVPA